MSRLLEWRRVGVLMCGFVANLVVMYGLIKVLAPWIPHDHSEVWGGSLAGVSLAVVIIAAIRATRSGVSAGQWRDTLIATGLVIIWGVGGDIVMARVGMGLQARGFIVLSGTAVAVTWLGSRWRRRSPSNAVA